MTIARHFESSKRHRRAELSQLLFAQICTIKLPSNKLIYCKTSGPLEEMSSWACSSPRNMRRTQLGVKPQNYLLFYQNGHCHFSPVFFLDKYKMQIRPKRTHDGIC